MVCFASLIFFSRFVVVAAHSAHLTIRAIGKKYYEFCRTNENTPSNALARHSNLLSTLIWPDTHVYTGFVSWHDCSASGFQFHVLLRVRERERDEASNNE